MSDTTRTVLMVVGIVLLAALLLPNLMGLLMMGGLMGPWMLGHVGPDHGGPVLLPLASALVGLAVTVLLLGSAAAAVVVLARRALPPPSSPLDILKERYARGEISRPEFEVMRRELE